MPSKEPITEMFNHISSTYDKVNSILSLGLHNRWKKKLIDGVPRHKNLIFLDVATGTGDVLIEALKYREIDHAFGVDLAENMLALGQKKAASNSFAHRSTFEVADAMQLPYDTDLFDCTCISFGIRNVSDPLLGLKEMRRVLKPGGKVLILEFSIPQNPFLKKAHLFYLRHLLPKIGGYVSKSPSSYVYLNKTIESFPYGEAFIGLMKQAGFKNPSATPLSGGIVTLYQALK